MILSNFQLELEHGHWINQPAVYSVENSELVILTEPGTDFWQRSFYGFRNDNAPALLFDTDVNFTLTTKVEFDYKDRFDQAGLIIYQDSGNWFKASVEFEDSSFGRLGSVVTNLGYSDWATTNIDMVSCVWYRLSRRGPDFLIEASFDGVEYNQIRIFHLHILGETIESVAKTMSLTDRTEETVSVGFYACSPLDSAFKAKFSEIKFEGSTWKAHS